MIRHIAAAVLAFSFAAPADAARVLLISIDGLRPVEFTRPVKELPLPNLRRLRDDGARASGVRGVVPTLTYPSHATLLTGVAPARHGIVSNLTFDPVLKNAQGWYWYASDLRVPTLWDAARKAGLSTANVHWPTSVGAAIDANLPQIWRTGMADDRKLLHALATPGLVDELEAVAGPYADGIDESITGDETRAQHAIALIGLRKPQFMTAYFTAFDHEQHDRGPDSREALVVLERIDAIVGRLVDAARKVDPDTVVAVVSDHGFAKVSVDVNLFDAFAKEGLMRFDAAGNVVAWDAAPWLAGGSADVVLRDRNDAVLRDRVRALLARLAADAANGIARVSEREAIAAAGGNPQADFHVDFKPGFETSPDVKTPLVTPSRRRGMHGYDPALPEMQASFLVAGKGVPRRDLGNVDMRDIAPTLAKVLGVALPEAEGKVLF
jgi:predicted AlkP superfamily pyrophosphatase or phosphodiesterase